MEYRGVEYRVRRAPNRAGNLNEKGNSDRKLFDRCGGDIIKTYNLLDAQRERMVTIGSARRFDALLPG